MVLINIYCTPLYCSYLWTENKKTSFNNTYRRIFGLSNRNSARAMYANYNISNLEAILRKHIYNFIQRLKKCTNSIIQVLMQSWNTKFEIWNHWHKTLYTCFYFFKLHLLLYGKYNEYDFLFLYAFYYHCIHVQKL